MAPHALTDLNDPSGYYPSTANKVFSWTLPFKKDLKPPITKPALSAKIPSGGLGFGSQSARNVWNLSSDEIDEIEKNVRYFLSMRKTSPLAYRYSSFAKTWIYRSAQSIHRRFLLRTS